jgi:hypothetical protein
VPYAACDELKRYALALLEAIGREVGPDEAEALTDELVEAHRLRGQLAERSCR